MSHKTYTFPVSTTAPAKKVETVVEQKKVVRPDENDVGRVKMVDFKVYTQIDKKIQEKKTTRSIVAMKCNITLSDMNMYANGKSSDVAMINRIIKTIDQMPAPKND